ncbi:Ig-like domain repeat protein [bacterium]|nr:Ig-like domain repeat protein [bacterium]
MKAYKGIYFLACLGLFLGTTAPPAFGAVPTITTIETKDTGGGTIYLNIATNITLVGTGTPGSVITVSVDGAFVPTDPAAVVVTGGGGYTCDFDTGASALPKAVFVREDGITDSVPQDILVDTTLPTIGSVTWTSPASGAFVGPNLTQISAAVSDAGGAGIDWSNSTLQLSPAIAYANTNGSGNIYFNPDDGWPESDGTNDYDFTHNTVYTIQVSIQDQAGNVATNNASSFTFDYVAPSITTVTWQSPVDGAYVGPNLTQIRSAVSDALAGIDWSNSTLQLSPAIAYTNTNGSGYINFNPSNGWPLSNGTDERDFVHNTTYTIQASIQDQAGNVATNNASSFNFDYVRPVITGNITNWQNPKGSPVLNGVYVGPSLNRVWTEIYDTTPGDSGIDSGASSITISSITGSLSYTAPDLDFTPSGGWPSGFVHNTLYTITSTIYDTAENVSVVTGQFRYDSQAPSVSIRWRYPYRTGAGVPYGASYYMGEDLNRIWGVLNGTVTTTFGTDPIDHANTHISIDTGAIGAEYNHSDGDGNIEWTDGAATYSLAHTNFNNGILYTVTVNLTDKAGNAGSYNRQFMKDEDAPVITDVETSDGSIMNNGYEGGLQTTYKVMRGANLPLNPNPFTADITDNPADWVGHTSLNGNGISLHAGEPSDMRLYYMETPALVGETETYSGTVNSYLGALTIPNSYSPIEGVYAVSVCARDWAIYNNNPAHRDNNLSLFLVDDTAPTVVLASVFPPEDPAFYETSGRRYMRTTDLTTIPQMISVTASDTPADRYFDLFGERLHLTESTVRLYNPDNVEYTLDSNNNWTRIIATNTDLNNNFVATITQAGDPPIFPIPDYIGNIIEGRYTINIYLQDRISSGFGNSNSAISNYYFFNDITPPRMVSWKPFSTIPLSDAYVSNFSDVQATIMDPDLRVGADGNTPGAGLNLPACAVDIYTGFCDGAHPTGFWNNPAGGIIYSTGPFIGPQGQGLKGEVVTVFRVCDVDQVVRGYYGGSPSDYNYGRKIFYKEVVGTVSESDGSISFSGLSDSESYVIGWQIPSTYAHDGLQVIGSIPNTAVAVNGFYFANCFVADMVGNTAQVESINFNYLSAGGVIYLTVNRPLILADGISTATVTTSQIHYSHSPETVVPDGTLVTVTSSLGTIISTDENTLTPLVVEVSTSGGVAEFVVQSVNREIGKTTLSARTVSGFADSGDVTGKLEMVLANMTNGTVFVDPDIENTTAEYTVGARTNAIIDLQSGVDIITLGFPEQTILPSSIPVHAITINNTPITNATITNQSISLLMPLPINAATDFTIFIPDTVNIINPPAGHYDLSIQSTQSGLPVIIPYDIIIHIADEEVVSAPNPSSIGRVRFFFNLDGPARVELVLLNLIGEKVSQVTKNYAAAKKGAVMDWNTARVGPGMYWALMQIKYDAGRVVKMKKKKVIIIK